MAARHGDGWWDATWNSVGGCNPVSPGCLNCYAAKLAATQHTARRVPLYDKTTNWRDGRAVFNGQITANPAGHPNWTFPLTWPGAKHPLLGVRKPSLIFVGLMSDLFHEDRPTATIDKVVATVALSNHIGLLLTKRAERMAAYFTAARTPKKRSAGSRSCG